MNSDNTPSSNPILIDTRNAKEIADLSEIIEDIDFINLETSDSFLIGNIDKVMFSKNSIFILDANKARGIFTFNRSGNALKKYKSIGKGPQEYIQLYDIIVSPDRENIQILADAQKVIKLSRNLEFVNESFLGFRGYCFASISDQNFYFQGETHTGELIVTDGLFNLEEKQFIFPNHRNVYSGFPFSTYNDKVFFNRFRCDTIFEVDGKSVIPSRILGLKLPGSLFRYDECEALSLIQTSSSIFLNFKSSNTSFVINKETTDDIFHLPFRSMRYLGFYEGKLVATLEPFHVLQNKELILNSLEKYEKSIRGSILELIDDISASQNPILLLIGINEPDGK
jgi:hypothetical protein